MVTHCSIVCERLSFGVSGVALIELSEIAESSFLVLVDGPFTLDFGFKDLVVASSSSTDICRSKATEGGS